MVSNITPFYVYKGTSLNEQLLPGPNLGPSLIGVLLRFQQHHVAISGEISGMFQQVRLLPAGFAMRDST